MNRKQIIAAALFTVIGSSAFAVEAEQVVVPQGALTRAEVQAELARARAAGELAFANESYGGVKEQSFAARGGAIDGPGPTVAGGMVFVSSGYGLFGQMPGNVLLAFGPKKR